MPPDSCLPRMRLSLDPSFRMPRRSPPPPRRVPGGERLGAYLIHVVSPLRLALDDLPGTRDGVGVVEPFALMAVSEHRVVRLVVVPRPVKDLGPPRLTGLEGSPTRIMRN